ncbi:Alpha-ribazole-5'-phosphate phosphatase [Furfurilactobacillus rossiae]|uniref:histidine phosphatase family protein n=1 Tax=Furfurilactobacillus rossiae TaxID=231049 RepID=UPI0015BC9C32|nr:histidine phosphatase family protein [Furfurilactobacillus rossiae]MCF6165835.1 histidine phosphatase family protein [Furfurilactobacillus rossiae]QLE64399.1 Alpha-ribazole-5'-phosphate phosphatase [Furfurilactobacillus rossiae]
MKLLLARHGETLLNAEHKFYGSLDVALDAVGKKQAEQLAQKIMSVPLTKIVSSGLKRSRQTATVISELSRLALSVDQRFNEKGCGQWEGLNADEIQARDPEFWQRWLDDPLNVTPPDAESFAVFRLRVTSAITSLLKQAQSTDSIMVVSHQGVARLINQILIPADDYWTPDFKAGSYTEYDLKQGKVVNVQRNL